MYKRTQVLFDNAVENLSLAITLGVIGRTHAEMGATSPEKLLPELAQEQGVAVGDQASRHAVDFNNHIEEQGGHHKSCMCSGKHP